PRLCFITGLFVFFFFIKKKKNIYIYICICICICVYTLFNQLFVWMQDLVGIFFVIAVVLDAPSKNGHTYKLMQTLYLYKFYIVIAPPIAWMAVTTFFGSLLYLFLKSHQGKCYFLFFRLIATVVVSAIAIVPVIFFGLALRFLCIYFLFFFLLLLSFKSNSFIYLNKTKQKKSLELAHCTIFAYFITAQTMSFTYTTKSYQSAWWRLFDYLQEGPDVNVRVACASHVLGYTSEYLDREAKTLYNNVTLKNLRQAAGVSIILSITYFLKN
ncbi:hypothetical protein RFI_19695, partial [Reticulomyxa filosa]